MEKNYTRHIKNIVLQDLSNHNEVVTKVFYSVQRVDEEILGEFIGTVEIKYIEEEFIKFEDLTENTVLSWIEQDINPLLETIYSDIDRQIEEKKRNTRFLYSEEFPWT